MNEMFLLSERQMVRISPHFPRSHGRPRVDDRRVISGIINVIRSTSIRNPVQISFHTVCKNFATPTSVTIPTTRTVPRPSPVACPPLRATTVPR